ncbi:MAG TPA: tetratricopeptide repeat protein [Candidatus Polarisedimenticolaceae bacterium]
MRPTGTREAAPYLLIVAAILAAYANAFPGSFQFDDWNVIANEPKVASLAAWWASMPGIRPLLKLSYAFNREIGLGVPGFVAFNVLVHAANAALVFAILKRLSTARTALLAALLFALHPVQTEAVTYVSGRSTSLAAMFALGSALAWMKGRRWLSPALFVLALGVKEYVAVLPLALILIEPKRWREVKTHVAVLAAIAAVVLATPTYRHLLVTSLSARPPLDQVRTQIDAILWLAGQVVRPDLLNADPMLPVRTSWDGVLVLKGVAIVGVLAAAWRWPALRFGVLWFFLWLLPTNSILPRLDVANDRQLYLPLVGVAFLIGKIPRSTWVVGALCAALVFSTHLRNRVYADEVVFWGDVARKSPENARAFHNLGYALALAGNNDAAKQAFEVALALKPDDWKTAVNLKLLREGALLPAPAGRR